MSQVATFRLAHLTDPHVGPLPRTRLRQLLGKRITGYVNWHRGRAGAHDMEILAALVADLREQEADHIACTGDTCNIGLPAEWPTSRLFLDELGDPTSVSFVPGNHDAYVPRALDGLLAACLPYVTGDEPGQPLFPYLRRRGDIALIGMSSAVPTPPFQATGKVGRKQMRDTEALLQDLRSEDCFRIVMIHHPPHVGGAPSGRNLTDRRAFEAMIARAGAELVIHGHNHVGSVATITGPDGPVPVIGAPSASARGGKLIDVAGYHVYTITRGEDGYLLEGCKRGLTPEGAIGTLGQLSGLPTRPVPFRRS